MQTATLDRMISRDASARLRAFRREIERALPGAVQEVILFGSRARGDAQDDSDYDVAILLTGDLADDRHVCHLLWELTWPHEIAGYSIQAVPMNAAAFQSDHPETRIELTQRIAAEGIPIR